VVLGEVHLRRILSAYADYYNRTRTHLALEKDAPLGRPVHAVGQVVAIPVLGGLHHQYARMAKLVGTAILDLNLESEQVLPVALELNDRGVPFVVVSGYERTLLPQILRSAPYVGKPVEPDQLLEVAAITFMT
jgi:hypothetical protein